MAEVSKSEDRNKFVAPFGVGSPRTVPMKVIVCSLSRTGTASMQAALRILGMPAYHSLNMMMGRAEDIEYWTQAIDAKYADGGRAEKERKSSALSRANFDQVLGDHMAVVDLPGSLFAPELAELYPDAKVIVLNRDPDAWFQSCRKAWPFRFSSVSFTILNWLLYWDKKASRIRTYLLKLHGAAWRFEWPDEDAEIKAKAFFKRYYAECRERIPAERRIEYSVQEGWGPLCRYLDVPIPTVRVPDSDEIVELPFPRYVQHCLARVQRHRLTCAARSNDAASFQKYQNNTITSLLKGGMYAWIGRISFIAAIAQAGYLARGSWLPVMRILQHKLRSS
jgi:hypothetical protein